MEKKPKNTVLFSCEHRRYKSAEQLTIDYSLVLIVSGTLELQFSEKAITLVEGDIAIVRKNELVKAHKIPDINGQPYASVTVFFSQELLRLYANRNNMLPSERYAGDPIHLLNNNNFIRTYFNSLLPYFDQPEKLSERLAALKSEEAVELLLAHNLGKFLFDFSEPHKIDLERFMNENFIYEIPISEFARLTGRSLSTFKRDFSAIYNSTPESWLRERRLMEARILINDGQKPSDVYHSVGFKNFSHFSLAYKKRFGQNPSDK